MSGEILKVMLVEDDYDHAEIVVRGLTNSTVETVLHRVTDGATALDYVFRRAAYIDAGSSPQRQSDIEAAYRYHADSYLVKVSCR